MPAEKHPSAHIALLALPLLLGVSQGSGQTMPEPPAVLAQTDAAGGEAERSGISHDSGANPCAYVPLFSKEAGMPGAEENDPERDSYGYILVGDECH